MTNFCSPNQFDASVLGLEDELRRKTPHVATTPAAAVGTPHVNGSTPGGASTVSGGGGGGDDARPRRKKRRRYDEGSYEGYDGFDGEEDAPPNNGSGGNGPGGGGGGMVSGGGGGGGGGWSEEKKKKKRKKVGMSSFLMFPLAFPWVDGLVHCFRQPILCEVERIFFWRDDRFFHFGLGDNGRAGSDSDLCIGLASKLT